MHLSEFFTEAIGSEEFSNLVTALSLLHRRVIEGEIPAELPTPMILRYVRNTGNVTFTYEDLLLANEDQKVGRIVKKFIANITPEKVKFNKGLDTSFSNPEDIKSASQNPEEKVSQMAKRALNRRQD